MKENKATAYSIGMAQLGTLALALALVLGLAVIAPGNAERAFASNDATPTLQAATPSAGEGNTLSAQLVSGKIAKTGKTATLNMQVGDKTSISTNGASAKKVKWKSSNKKVVTVKSAGKYKGKITAMRAGKATITAITGTGKLTCKVTVKGKLSKTTVSLTIFETKTVKLKGAKVKKWKSSNTKIAQVNKKGKITPMGVGPATLTCTDKLGNKYSCTVNVKCPNITCKMLNSVQAEDEKGVYYVKHFQMNNRSGKALNLKYSPLLYYPNGLNGSRYQITAGGVDGNMIVGFTASPKTVANRTQYNFASFGDDYTDKTDDGIFLIYFNVGSVRYGGAFFNSGGMLSAVRV